MSRSVLPGLALGAVVTALFALGGGCLTRPVVRGNPQTITNFTFGYNATTIDKVDILFDIDNSSSMGDKQQYLQAAVPDLVTRLIQPNCIDNTGAGILANGVQLTADPTTGKCTMGQAESPPVHDMHVGVITSSLGGRGTTTLRQTMATPDASAGDYNEYTTGSYQQFLTDEENNTLPGGLTAISKNNDDQAHLINRTDPPTDPNAPPSPLGGSFLAWAPTGSMDAPALDAVTETSATQLNTDFQDLVVGAQAHDCGIESQLETWYRFLVQPDPYQSITTTQSKNGLIASWSGVDNTILHDLVGVSGGPARRVPAERRRGRLLHVDHVPDPASAARQLHQWHLPEQHGHRRGRSAATRPWSDEGYWGGVRAVLTQVESPTCAQNDVTAAVGVTCASTAFAQSSRPESSDPASGVSSSAQLADDSHAARLTT